MQLFVSSALDLKGYFDRNSYRTLPRLTFFKYITDIVYNLQSFPPKISNDVIHLAEAQIHGGLNSSL